MWLRSKRLIFARFSLQGVTMSVTRKAYRLTILVATTIAVGGLTAASSAMAQSNHKAPEALEGAPEDRRAPLLLRIEAKQRELSAQQMTVTFTGDVRATLGDTTIRCESLVAHYEQSAASAGARAAQPGPNDAQWIHKLVVTGAVVLDDRDKSATADSGVFDLRSELAALVGTVVVIQGMTVTRAERLVANLATGIWQIHLRHAPPRR
jgi:lipopolysaccharide export system protein LptA